MKIIQKVIPLILAVLFIVMSCLSVMDAMEKQYETDFSQMNIMKHIEKLTENGSRSVFHKESNEKAIDYIAEVLEGFGLVNEDTTDTPAYLIQEYVTDDIDYNNFYLKNVIARIPANSDTPSGDTVMFMGHTDSVPMGEGASDDGVAVSVMLEAVNYYTEKMKNGFVTDHDLLFAFVNGEEFGLYGSAALANEFEGFDGVVDKIKFVCNLESRGTEGTVIMFETADNNYNTIKLFSEVNENLFTCSIATLVYSTMPNSTDFSNFNKTCQGLNMANILGGENYHTQNDSYENVGKTYVSQQAMIVDSLIEKLAHYELDELYNADENAVFFSYLNMSTVVYTPAAAMVLGIILIVFVVVNIVLGYKKRKTLDTFKGIVSLIVTLVVSAGVMLGAYYLFQVIAVAAGVIDPNMIGTITYSNKYIVIGMGLLVIAIAMIISRLAVKLLKISYRDLVRAFAYTHAVLGAVISFVLPDASYLLAISGFMFMIVELVISCISKCNVHKLHLELLATALYMPIILPVIFLATSALGMTMSYVYGLVFALGVFDIGVFAAEVLTFEKGDKKGRVFIPSVCIIIVCAIVLFVCVSTTKPNASVNLQGKQNIAKLPFDDALVYAEDADGNAEYRIYDLNAYSYVAPYANDMTFNGEYYVGEPDEFEVMYSIKSTASENVLNVSRYSDQSLVYLTFKNVDGESFTIDDGTSSKTYTFTEGEDYNITINTDCTVTFNGTSAEVEYKEVLRDYGLMIPAEYTPEEKLHFNLWLLDSFELK